MRLGTARIQLDDAKREQAVQATASARAGESTFRVLLAPITAILGALLTALVAYIAVVLPLKAQRVKDREERKRAAEEDIVERREAAEKKGEQDRQSLVQRFDSAFAAALSALADPHPAAQASGAAALQSYLRTELTDFRDQTYLAVRAHLDRRLDHPDAVRAILVATLEDLLRGSDDGPGPKLVNRTASSGIPEGIRLAWTWLRGADLRTLNLAGSDLAFCDLRAARLDGASLRRVRAWKADLTNASLRGADLEEGRFRAATASSAVFSDARLVSARFEEATLDRARFRGAMLQSAHFDGARLRGADFRNANVTDAKFGGVMFDEVALTSLVLSHGLWKVDPTTGRGCFTAQLDPEAGERLRHLAARRGWKWIPA
ncbi:MAG: pentapeptide repeat-containing protein [Solirubrobacteraceae bacterium]